jgi:dipeptidyl-peptidase-3
MKKIILLCMTSILLATNGAKSQSETPRAEDFNYIVDRFADIEVLRYRVDGFEDLTLQQKLYIYYLSQATEAGRDILFDQNYKHNLYIRRILENIYLNYDGDRNSEDFKQFEIYLKRVWFSNGIHHHYSMDKFVPGFSREFFNNAISGRRGRPRGIFDPLLVIFDSNIDSKRVNQTEGEDLIQTSANNYYITEERRELVTRSNGVDRTMIRTLKGSPLTQREVEDFYNAKRNLNDLTPISYGLNSRLFKHFDGELEEQVWKIGGMYSKEIEKIVYYLEKAKTVAENDRQKNIISLLIDFYTTGCLKTFDEYSIAWVQDTDSHIDFLNGFIETYGDPLGIKGSWEALVNFKNIEATKRTEIISANAQWFEDNSPVDERFKKAEVKGVSAKVITVAMLGGDCYPAAPLGINLPNSNWIREMHGSKSVTLNNISEAYFHASKGNGFNEEFMYSQVEIERREKYGKLTDDLHTDLHELGHGSGQLLAGVSPDALRAYGAVIEEARADLFALYHLADPKMVELGLLPNEEAYKAQYYNYMMNGLMTQLVRIEFGKDIEQTHMRNRQMVAWWVLAHNTTVEFTEKDNKIFVKINDYESLRETFGQLLSEIQRIKSEGDFEMAKSLVEKYGIIIDAGLHSEILERYKKLDIAPFRGFVNPVYTPALDEKGEIIDIEISYDEGFVEQHLRYSRDF